MMAVAGGSGATRRLFRKWSVDSGIVPAYGRYGMCFGRPHTEAVTIELTERRRDAAKRSAMMDDRAL